MVSTHHEHLLLLLSAVMCTVTVVLPAVMLAIVREMLRLSNACVLLRQQIVQLNMKRSHRRKFLQHLCQKSLKVFLSLLLLLCLLLHLWNCVENWAQEIHNIVLILLLIVLVKALEEICLVVTSKEAFDPIELSLR